MSKAKAPAEEPGAFFIRAAVDVGTNSVKCLVAKFEGGAMEVLADSAVVTRLGDEAGEGGALSREAMARTAAVMGEMCREARRLGAGEITAVGTQALRAAGNRDEFIRLAESACGVRVRVISGDEEAGLSFRAAVSSARGSAENILMFDVGGGSSEIVLGKKGSLIRRASVPVGALSLYKKFFSRDGKFSAGDVGEAERHAASACGVFDFGSGEPRGCVGIGGTVTTLASVAMSLSDRNYTKADGFVLSSGEVSRQIDMYASASPDERKKIPGLPAERADIILPGAVIVKTLMKMAGHGEITVCGRGLRHGLIC